MAGSKVKKIICNSCGAEFEDTLPECPYCGTMNYKGAEMEYFGRLEEVRSDMEQLGSVPEQETRSELKKQRKWILKLVLFLAVAAVLLFLGMKWREFRYSDQRDNRKSRNHSNPYGAVSGIFSDVRKLVEYQKEYDSGRI